MSSIFCFWSLLTIQDLKFLYVPSYVGNILISITGSPIQDVLLHKSLFDLIHPDEVEVAKTDLTNYLKLKTPAGSITKCRILSLESLAKYTVSSSSLKLRQNTDDMTWSIIDLVMYTSTNSSILAFFHYADFTSCLDEDKGTHLMQHLSCTQTGRKSFVYQDKQNLAQTLNYLDHSPLQPNQYGLEMKIGQNVFKPLRIFQILDRQNQQPVFMWPQSPKVNSFVDMIIAQSENKMILKEFKGSSYDYCTNHATLNLSSPDNTDLIIPCARHFYASTKIKLSNNEALDHYHIQKLFIPYSDIIFESIQITPTMFYHSLETVCDSYPSSPKCCAILDSPSPPKPFIFTQANLTTSAENDTICERTVYGPYVDGSTNISVLNQKVKKPTFNTINSGIISEEKTSALMLPILSPGVTSTYLFAEEVNTTTLQSNERNSQYASSSLKAKPLEYASIPKRDDNRISGELAVNENIHIKGNNVPDNSTVSKPSLIQKTRAYQGQRTQKPKSHQQQEESLPFVNKGKQLVFQNYMGRPGVQNNNTRVCTKCNTSNSPEWRRGPDGHKTFVF
ncbi:MAG: hypothetical protein EXX96DRAFT_623140 [Benjaminiella poitrasii]|nr:MAG: hypothetical protein EXX96DRAFT_623140 [Benjaminiella poitrasii]